MENTVVDDNNMADEAITTQDDYADDSSDYVVVSANDGNDSDDNVVDNGGAEVQGNASEPVADTQKKQGFYKSQQEVNAAFKARLNDERKKYQNDINLSGKIRTMFKGMTDEQISDALIEYNASKFSTENDVPIAVAKKLTSLELQIPNASSEIFPMERTPAANDNQGDRIALLAQQAEQIEKSYGVNMTEVLSKSPELSQKVFSEGLDLRDAYIEYLTSQTSTLKPKPNPVTPVKHSNGASDLNIIDTMSEKQRERIRASLRAGHKVRLN